MTALPSTPDDLTPDWLSETLAVRHPGVRVAAVEVVARSEMTNSHARLRICYDEASGAPASMFCKMLPSRPKSRALIAATGMGPREVRFYSEIARQVDLRVPKTYVAIVDECDEAFVLLIEDLVAGGCGIFDGTVGLTPDAAARALEDLADLHSKYGDAAQRAAGASWVQGPMESDYGAVMLRHGLDHHRDRLTPCFAEHAELYIEQRSALHAVWREGPHTVIHGDPHIGNLFDDGGRTGFLDWGLINVGTPLRDVSYLLVMAMSIADRRASERALLEHYFEALRAKGGPAIDANEGWMTHRVQAAYAVPACCQIVLFPDEVTGARKVFAENFLARAEAALEDLEVRDALRRAAKL